MSKNAIQKEEPTKNYLVKCVSVSPYESNG